MKIALVHDWLTGMRGGEKCLEVLCRHFPDATLHTLLHKPGSTSPTIERMRTRTSFLDRLPGIARHYRYWLPLMPRAIESLRLPDDVDLVVSLSHAVSKGVLAPPGVPHVCYCFTPMRWAWHLRDEYFGPARRGPRAWLRERLLDRLRDWDRRTADRVTRFVAISHAVADRIAECYGRPSEVIYPPVDTDYYTPDPRVEREGYYLVVSALVPYKRIDLAIDACRQLGRRLVIVGAGPERQRLARRAGPRTTFLGWQTDAQIRDHLRRCRALVFPGHEDFGIVPVEAQACGAPVIAYARGGATETVGDDTGVFFARPTRESLVAAIERFESRRARFSPAAARAQAENFRVARFEREMLDYLEQVAGHVAVPLHSGDARSRHAWSHAA